MNIYMLKGAVGMGGRVCVCAGGSRGFDPRRLLMRRRKADFSAKMKGQNNVILAPEIVATCVAQQLPYNDPSF